MVIEPTAEPMLVPTSPKFPVALLREPQQAAANIQHGLPVGLQGEADIRPTRLSARSCPGIIRRSW